MNICVKSGHTLPAKNSLGTNPNEAQVAAIPPTIWMTNATTQRATMAGIATTARTRGFHCSMGSPVKNMKR